MKGFLFGKDGSVTIDPSKMEGAVIPLADELIAVDLGAEVAGYEGETGQYTSKPYVAAVQNGLIALGETFAGGADGKYGPATKTALNNVENGLGVNPSASKTVQTIINVAVALVKANKANAAKTMINNLGADMGKNPIIERIRKIIEDPTITDKIKAIQTAQTAASDKNENPMANVGDLFGASTVAESTFSESYKRMFGLTLD